MLIPTCFIHLPFRDSGRGFVIGSANRRLVPEKGVDLLLLAAAKLPGIWRVLIAGDGPERPYLEQLAVDLGIKDRVHFEERHIFLPNARLSTAVRCSRPFLTNACPIGKNSSVESWLKPWLVKYLSLALIQAKFPHVIGDGGLIFAEDDVAALGKHLLKLMQSEDQRQQLGTIRPPACALNVYTSAGSCANCSRLS